MSEPPVPPPPRVPPLPPVPPLPDREPPSADVAAVGEESALPGAHRGGFQRLPTAPVGVTSVTAPSEPGGVRADTAELLPVWMPPPPVTEPHRGLGGWALAFSVVGLAVSLFVGWGFPLGLVGIVTAIIALRRPFESRAVAVWALVLGVVSVLYSAGWLVWAATRMNLFG